MRCNIDENAELDFQSATKLNEAVRTGMYET